MKLSMRQSHDPATRLLGMYPKQIKTCPHSDLFIPSYSWSSARRTNPASTSKRMDKHTAVQSHVDNHSDRKERVIDMGKHSNELQKHPAERKEPGGKEHGPDFHTKFESRNNYFRLTESRSAAARCQGRAWADDADVLCRAHTTWVCQNSWACTPRKGGLCCITLDPSKVDIKKQSKPQFPRALDPKPWGRIHLALVPPVPTSTWRVTSNRSLSLLVHQTPHLQNRNNECHLRGSL